MWEDPIVTEIHKTREQMAAKYNFDLHAFFADLRTRQVASGEKVILQKHVVGSVDEVDQNHDACRWQGMAINVGHEGARREDEVISAKSRP